MSWLGSGDSYFSVEAGRSTRLFYFALLAVTITYSVIAMAAPLLTPTCTIPLAVKGSHRLLGQGLEGGLEDAPNPSYQPDPCRWIRYFWLLGMNKWEADMSRRIVMSILMGSIIGFERRRADRPAGIRTMAMVCLGSCVFTIGSIYAFLDGTMGWDASRVSAAIPSGVGFLGAASIWKGTKSSGTGDQMTTVPEVHGLTTATSVWLAAAVGILCGGALYVPAFFTTFLGVVYLRFAPRLNGDEPKEEEAHNEASLGDAEAALNKPLAPNSAVGAGASPPPGVMPSPDRGAIERQGSAKRLSNPLRKPSILA